MRLSDLTPYLTVVTSLRGAPSGGVANPTEKNARETYLMRNLTSINTRAATGLPS